MTQKKNNLKLAVIIPTVNEELNISILINKIAPTPDIYPREYKQILKKPL